MQRLYWYCRTSTERLTLSHPTSLFLSVPGETILKPPRTAKSQKARTSNKKSEKEPLAPKLVFEITGPCGRMFVQARTPDQARGVYLAACPSLPRELGCVEIIGLVDEPTDPYLIIQHKRRKRPAVALRFPTVQIWFKPRWSLALSGLHFFWEVL